MRQFTLKNTRQKKRYIVIQGQEHPGFYRKVFHMSLSNNVVDQWERMAISKGKT